MTGAAYPNVRAMSRVRIRERCNMCIIASIEYEPERELMSGGLLLLTLESWIK